ncbi:cyclic peptide export ABC transporter [Fictibacillus fluitans]
MLISWIAIVLLVLFIPAPSIKAADGHEDIPSKKLEQIRKWTKEQMKKAEIPGMSITIVQGRDTIFQQGFGYADVSSKKEITDSALFEIGSNSKAFTGLAVLKLEKEGKLKLNAPVSRYLPWLKLTYKGKPAEVTIEQLLHHTSGIPFESIGHLPKGDGNKALEKTVRTLVDQPLNREPGKSFEYATINYDVLGLIIEKVSEEGFSTYMEDHLFHPMGLNSTFVLNGPFSDKEKVKGYKFFLTNPHSYQPPYYSGNAPAGYVVSSAQDMALWLKLQLGTIRSKSITPSLLKTSHSPNRSVNPDSNGSSYAAGWDVYQKGKGEISHAGNNPTFSSFIAMRPKENIGVVVLANLNSDYTQIIGQGILNQLIGDTPGYLAADTYKKVDAVASWLIVVLSVLCIIISLYISGTIRSILKRERIAVFRGIRPYLSLTLHLALLCVFGIALYKVPDILFYHLTWSFVRVWLPSTVMIAIWLMASAGLLYACYSILLTFFPRQKDKSLLGPIFLGVVSGFGNAFVIFIINEAIVRKDNLTNGLLFYFAMAIVMYVAGQRYLRARLVNMTNEIIYQRRMELIDKLLNTSFTRMESFERGRVEATLNNDTEVISRSIGIVISGATNLITLVFCFLYLGIMNLYALILSILIIALLAGLYMYVGNRANKLMEETRDLQNVFFGFISDLTEGFKELALHQNKRKDFRQSIHESCRSYKEKRNVFQLRYSDIFVLGELLFVLVIGCVVFIFPELFKQMNQTMLSNYVFVFLYMTGPVNQLLDSVPHLAQIKVSWERIRKMITEVDMDKSGQGSQEHSGCESQSVCLQLNNVVYRYRSELDIQQSEFEVGPIHYEFLSGTVVFITGGNGSGKSTLAKLLTGLYQPHSGTILLNGKKVSGRELGNYYSAIFGDYHLFDRLYGIDWEAKKEEIGQYLQLLKLHDKVTIQKGVFSTTKLSTGQKKRLALLISYLEDRPICLFDEWAADQDPEYRRFFYQVLLPEMKASGKCVIAITHDDHYFHLADHVIKMDAGKMTILQVKSLSSSF